MTVVDIPNGFTISRYLKEGNTYDVSDDPGDYQHIVGTHCPNRTEICLGNLKDRTNDFSCSGDSGLGQLADLKALDL